MTPLPAPACMDPDDYDRWQALNALAVGNRVPSPCADCITSFALEMRAIGRCDGTPLGIDDEDPPLPAPPKPRGRWSAKSNRLRAEGQRRYWSERAPQERRDHLVRLQQSPEMSARKAEAMRERWADPEHRAKIAAAVAASPKMARRRCSCGECSACLRRAGDNAGAMRLQRQRWGGRRAQAERGT